MILRARFVLVLVLAWEDPRRGTRVPRVSAVLGRQRDIPWEGGGVHVGQY